MQCIVYFVIHNDKTVEYIFMCFYENYKYSDDRSCYECLLCQFCIHIIILQISEITVLLFLYVDIKFSQADAF
jgi:hypothetical protein